MNLKDSETKKNLMRAFAGESQARNRYNIAASVAKKEGHNILKDLFDYIADQEKAHAKEYMKRLKVCSGEDVLIDAEYPAEVESDTLTLLRAAQKHEKAECEQIYPEFAKKAREEGFEDVAVLFERIATIEKIHAERFKKYGDMLENGTLYKSDKEEQWICTNCGYIHEGKEAPEVCPVCTHPQGHYIRFSNLSFE